MEPKQEKILGIDYGTKRVGVAVSDPSQTVAMPLCILQNSLDLIDEIIKTARDNSTNKIVVGDSRDFRNKPNTIWKEVQEMCKELEKRGFIIYLEPEFLTSVQAERIQGKNDMIDASAGALILQSYLDKQKNK